MAVDRAAALELRTGRRGGKRREEKGKGGIKRGEEGKGGGRKGGDGRKGKTNGNIKIKTSTYLERKVYKFFCFFNLNCLVCVCMLLLIDFMY